MAPETPMTRHLITAGILLAAIALYAAGADSGSAGLVSSGVLLELVFWYRLHPFAGRAPRRLDSSTRDGPDCTLSRGALSSRGAENTSRKS